MGRESVLLLAGFWVAALVGPGQSAPAMHDHGATAGSQDLTPVRQVGMYLDGFHTYDRERGLPGDRQTQRRVAHYCMALRDDLFQCLIYDGNSSKAKLIGIEYVISGEAYRGLPTGEKRYWHPHDGEVDSGMLALPGLAAADEKAILAKLRSTWGKTWHVWDPPGQAFPLGEPQLMWAVDPAKRNAETGAAMQRRRSDPAF